MFLILLETSSMDCSYEGTCSLYLNIKYSAVQCRLDLPGWLPVLSQRHLPVVRRHGGSRGGDAVHEGSLGRRRTGRKIHHLPEQSRRGRRLHLIFLTHLLQWATFREKLLAATRLVRPCDLVVCFSAGTFPVSGGPGSDGETLSSRRSPLSPLQNT